MGKESNSDNADVCSVQTLRFHEITFCLHEKHILKKKKLKKQIKGRISGKTDS